MGWQDHSRYPEFQRIVLSHYEKSGRRMPWRDTPDPYPVLVSEIMLQQTQVDRVMVRFPAFVSAFPDFPSLAAAPLPDVLSAWQGLGTTGGPWHSGPVQKLS